MDTKEITAKLFCRPSGTPVCPVPRSKFPASTPIGMMYVPYQKWETPYEAELALSRGTIFPCLDLPFIGREAAKNADV